MGSTRTASYVRDRGDGEPAGFLAPQLVVAFECQRPLGSAARYSLGEVDEVVIGRGAARAGIRYSDKGRPLLRVEVADAWLSNVHARLIRDADGWQVEDAGSKNGTSLRGERLGRELLVDGDLVEVGRTLLFYRGDVPRAATDQPDFDAAEASDAPESFRTLSLPLRRQLDALRRVARGTSSVLVLGESGTGKELAARAVHELSGRRGPFVPVNCGAIADALVESELFGHRRGAFSGAHEDRVGLVRSAQGGTLFLDEVAELPEASQVALLRFLQEGEVRPVGDTAAVKVDVRVVAATHQALPERIAAGRFRQDLYGRLAGFLLPLPPLRERREDIGMLVATLLPRVAGAAAAGVTFRRAAAQALFAYDWPLNVRELENALRSAVALADKEIGVEHLPPAIQAGAGAGGDEAPGDEEQALRAQLTALLKTHAGNVSAVGRALGKAPIRIRRWCKRFGIDLDGYRG